MKYFKTFEKYKYGVNGVGSLRNSLAALKRQNINSRYVDEETLAQGIRNEYEAITGEKYEDEIQMSMDNTIADIIGHFKLDGPDFMAAWDKVVKESVNDAYNNLEKIFGTDQETMDMFQGIEDKGTVKDMIEFIDEFGDEEMLSRYGIRSTAQVKKLAKTIMDESVNEQYTKSLGFNVTNDNIYKLTKSLDPNGRLCKNISKGSDNVKPEFTEMQKLMEEIQRIWGEVEYIISMSNESVNENPEEVTESYKGNFTDFKYDLEMAIDNMDISPKSIKSVKKKGKGYEVRLSSYMSDKSTWEKIGDTIGATLISFKPGSINIGIYE
tara:strand:+ start:791 stop:1762 length:972 start_codon:yes stop_codon:yes gene_type:complete